MGLHNSLIHFLKRLTTSIVDKMIIAFSLFIVATDVSAGFQQMSIDMVTSMLIVFALYAITVTIASIPKLIARTENRWSNLILGGFSALFIWLLFPKLLEWTFFILNLLGWITFQISVPIQNILLITFVFRAFLIGYMKRRWAT